MSATSRPRMGLKDAKRLSRALQKALAHSRPTTLDQCQDLVARLPLPDSGFSSETLWSLGTHAQLVQYFIERLPKDDYQIWCNRALGLISAVLHPLVWQRDHQALVLTESGVLEHLDLDSCLCQAQRADLPEPARVPLQNYLRSLPGFRLNVPHQIEVARDAHEWVAMMFKAPPRPPAEKAPATVFAPPVHSDDPLVVEGTAPAAALPLGQVLEDKPGLTAWMRRAKSKPLSWTGNGLLHHGLMLGCCGSGQTETALSLAVNAMDQGLGLTLINAHGDPTLPSRVLKQAASRSPSAIERVRVITMMEGFDQTPPTHSFNPFAEGPAPQHVELLIDALSVPHAIDALPATHQQLLIPLMSAALLPLVWGRDRHLWPLDLAQISRHLRLPALLALRDIPQLPSQLRAALNYFFGKLSQACPGQTQAQAYAPFEQVLVGDILEPIAKTYAHVLAAPIKDKRWRLPDVSAKRMIEERLITVVNLRALERCPILDWVAARLVTSALSAEVVSQTQRAKAPATQPRHVVIAQHAPLHLSGRAASQLLRFGGAAGVGCLLTASDYPQLKTIPQLSETVEWCHTKFFMKPCHDQAHAHAAQLVGPLTPSSEALAELSEGVAHVIAGSTLWKATLDFHPTPQGPAPALPPGMGHWQSLGPQGFAPGQVDRMRMARVLRDQIQGTPDPITLSWCQETIARMLGYAHWHELRA